MARLLEASGVACLTRKNENGGKNTTGIAQGVENGATVVDSARPSL
jgi:hypothetical protein